MEALRHRCRWRCTRMRSDGAQYSSHDVCRDVARVGDDCPARSERHHVGQPVHRALHLTVARRRDQRARAIARGAPQPPPHWPNRATHAPDRFDPPSNCACQVAAPRRNRPAAHRPHGVPVAVISSPTASVCRREAIDARHEARRAPGHRRACASCPSAPPRVSCPMTSATRRTRLTRVRGVADRAQRAATRQPYRPGACRSPSPVHHPQWRRAARLS